MRMVRSFIGEDAFKSAVQRYISLKYVLFLFQIA